MFLLFCRVAFFGLSSFVFWAAFHASESLKILAVVLNASLAKPKRSRSRTWQAPGNPSAVSGVPGSTRATLRPQGTSELRSDDRVSPCAGSMV